MLKKVKLLLPILIWCSITCYAQMANVTGNIPGLRQNEVIINYIKDGKPTADTVKANAGKFKWAAKMPEPQKVYTKLFDRYFYFFVESGDIDIAGGKSVYELKITGSKSQLEYEAYQQTVKDINDQESVLYQKRATLGEQDQIKLEIEFDGLEKQRQERIYRYIADHPKSPVSIDLLLDKSDLGNYADVVKYFKKLDPSAQNSAQGKRIAERLTLLKKSDIGEKVFNFTQSDTSGKAVRYSDFKGKYVFIDFWASWCGPCRAENPRVLKAYNLYKDKNFTVVGISLDENREYWKKAILEDHMPWTQVSDLKGIQNEVSTYYGIVAIPSTLLVDPQGKILAKDLRGDALDKKLAELFK